MKKLIVTLLSIPLLISCTENSRAKNFGGEAEITLPKGRKLVNVTWKENELWYLTRKAREGELPETLSFEENSSFGILEGKVTFIEQ